jgi:hypothetical protein
MANWIKTTRNSVQGQENSENQSVFVGEINRSVLQHLENVLGPIVLVTINYHLRKVANVDTSELMSKPAEIESALHKFFGAGSKIIIQQCILAIYRSVGLIPDRDFVSLEDAVREVRSKADQSNP